MMMMMMIRRSTSQFKTFDQLYQTRFIQNQFKLSIQTSFYHHHHRYHQDQHHSNQKLKEFKLIHSESNQSIKDNDTNSLSKPNHQTISPYSPKDEINSFKKPFYITNQLKSKFSINPIIYQSLSKSRLSILIVLTTMSSYAVYPTPTTTDLMIHPNPSNQIIILLSTALGTFLSSASANTFNQILESPMDAQMMRTRNRVMVRKSISTGHAASFGILSGISGIGILYYIVNPIASYISAITIFTYVLIYTPFKRISIINTWLGSLVGALPPLIGSISAAGHLSSQALFQLQSWLIPILLYVWQFPHFNALSHTIRRDYVKAGYRMCSSLNPYLNAKVSLRYSLICLPLCSYLIPLYSLSNWYFSFLSLIPNLYLILPAFRFWLMCLKENSRWLKLLGWARGGSSKTSKDLEAKKLFWASLIHLPSLLILMILCRP